MACVVERSHSVTCTPSRLSANDTPTMSLHSQHKLVLILPIPEGWKAERLDLHTQMICFLEDGHPYKY